ncbi:MAG: hypothetical protein RIB58_06805 [Phycisphaerales bacterium]
MAIGQTQSGSGGGIARWAVALPVSLAVHLAVGLLLIRGGVDPARLAAAAERDQNIEIPIKLGIERSDALTPNWLGFAEPTPHAAAPSIVEQALLTRAQGDAFDNLARAVTAQAQAASTQAMTEAQALLDALRAELARAVEEARQVRPEPEPSASPAETQPQPTPEPQTEPKEAQDEEQDGSPGKQDTRTSPAASLPMDIRRTELGQVVAAEGLKINTTRMHLTDLQRVLGRPPSPLVEIFFDHTGQVSRARIPAGRGSGRADIDNALINAIYEWSATGERIDELQEGDRPVLVRMRILL